MFFILEFASVELIVPLEFVIKCPEKLKKMAWSS